MARSFTSSSLFTSSISIRRTALLALAAALGIGHAVAMADGPVGVDGIIGPEWNGVPAVTVTHDDSAAESNFSTPTNLTTGASYTVQVRDDGSYYYVLLDVTGNAASSPGSFANLYFDTDPQNNNGSDVGFEVTNDDFFIPGVSGTFNASQYLTYNNSNPGVIELAIANSFFTSGPLAGLAYPNGYPAATGDVVLRLSQSFGYSVAGGDSYGDTRLGSASVTTAAVPEPSTWASLLGGLGMLAYGWRFNRRRIG